VKHRAAIACITVPRRGAPPTRGTGTLVAERLVITALHVVADRQQNPPEFFPGPISLAFPGKTVVATPVAGMWDPAADWVLLECAEAPGIEPAPLGELGAEDQDIDFETFGFPDTKPDGMRLVGKVRDPAGKYQQIEAIQLYCEEASDGAPMAGLSGAPCLIEGALVGVIRSALQTQGRTVAGTLFGCPLATVLDRAEALLRLPDPCRGLPGLPRRDLPQYPYPSLGFYGEAEAEVFFGRSAAIADLYKKVTDPDGEPIVLFFGQSGVGKSSLLDAGLKPRLQPARQVRYARRDAESDLAACFRDATQGDLYALEETAKCPVVVILDQVEEAFTRPRAGPQTELSELLDALEPIFGVGGKRPRGRLVLSLRKEWFPEVEARLAERRIPFSKHFLERLDRAGVLEVVHGLRRTKRLIRRYEATIDPHLGEDIAASLINDDGSPVAPTLQILMTRLWAMATKDPSKKPALTRGHLAELKTRGIHLADFLRQQVQALPATLKPLVDSGLVDDLLQSHTTTLGTAATRTIAELNERYPRIRGELLNALLNALQTAYLLTNPQEDSERDKARLRLGHDTLAPLVRDRFIQSSRPGQQARSLLEGHAGEWEGVRSGGRVLDQAELRLVEQGLVGMRALTEAEARLLNASRAAHRRRRFALAFAVVAALTAAVIGANLYSKASTAEATSSLLERQTKSDEARRLFDRANEQSEPTEALLAACRAVEVAPDDDPRLQLYIDKAQHLFAQIAPMRAPLSGELVRRADLSDDWTRILVQDLSGRVQIWPVDLYDAARGIQLGEAMTLAIGDAGAVADAHLSRDGRWALTGGGGAPLQVWDGATGKSVLLVPDVGVGAFFAPGSRFVMTALDQQGPFKLVAALGVGNRWEARTADVAGRPREPVGVASNGTLTLTVTSHPAKSSAKTQIEILDIESGRAAFPQAGAIEIDGRLTSAGLTRSGDYVATMSRGVAGGLNASVWKTLTGEKVWEAKPRHQYEVIWGIGEVDLSLVVGQEPSSESHLQPLELVRRDDKEQSSLGSCSGHADQAAQRQFDSRDGSVFCDTQEAGEHRIGLSFFAPAPRRLSVEPRQSVAWWPSPERDRVASISSNGWLEVHRLKTAAVESPLAPSTAGTIEVAKFSPSAKHLLTTELHGGRLALWTGERWTAAWSDHIDVEANSTSFDAAISPSGAHVAIASNSRVRRWDVTSSAHTDTPMTGTVRALVFDGDGPTLVVGSEQFGVNEDSPFLVLEWARDGAPSILGRYGNAHDVAYRSWSIALDGRERYVVDESNLTMELRRIGSPEVASLPLDARTTFGLAKLLFFEAPQLGVRAMGPSNVTVLVGTTPPVEVSSILGLTTIRPQAGQPYIASRVGTNQADLAFSPSGPWTASRPVYVVPVRDRGMNGNVVISSLAAGVTLDRLPHPTDVIAAAFTPDGDRLRTIARDAVVREWFIRHRYTKKPAWLSRLAAFTTGAHLVDGGAVKLVPDMLSGSGRAALIQEITAAATAGDGGAAFVLQHILGTP
jgi:hypothetical protein